MLRLLTNEWSSPTVSTFFNNFYDIWATQLLSLLTLISDLVKVAYIFRNVLYSIFWNRKSPEFFGLGKLNKRLLFKTFKLTLNKKKILYNFFAWKVVAAAIQIKRHEWMNELLNQNLLISSSSRNLVGNSLVKTWLLIRVACLFRNVKTCSKITRLRVLLIPQCVKQSNRANINPENSPIFFLNLFQYFEVM